jgi:hypothetical protein
MTPDPKLGYHWLWMVPVVYLWLLVSACVCKLTQYYQRARMRYITWRYPQLHELRVKAGIDKDHK